MPAKDGSDAPAQVQKSAGLSWEVAVNTPLPPVDVPNAPTMYDGVEYRLYWQGLSRKKLDELERAILLELLPRHGQAVVDLGCGYGRLFACYADRFEHLILFDGSESLLRQARTAHGERALYVLGDLEHLPFRSAVFDAVVMVRVFHHLNHPEHVVRSIGTILCRDGALIMNYSNKRNALQIMKYLFGMTNHNPFTLDPLTAEANFFHHHPASISRLLADLGFQKVLYRGAGVFDKLAPLFGRLKLPAPSGMRLAPLLGKTALSPWIFCKAGHPNSIHPEALEKNTDVLACPACTGELIQSEEGFSCVRCSRFYPYCDGILDMRVLK